MTEDSYSGSRSNPLSQNRYAYVQNNPVNYTDPSGHFWKSIKRVASNAWNGVKRAAGNAWNATKTFVGNAWNATKTFVGNAWNATKTFVGNAWNATKTFVGNAWNATKTFVGNVWNTATNWFGNQVNGVYQAGQQVYHSASSYAQAQYQQMQAEVQAQQLQAVRHEYAQATGIKGTPKSREARNLLRNWGAALAKTLKHVCTTAKRVGKQIVKAAKKIDWKKVAIVATATVAAVAVTVATAGVAAPFVAGMLGVTSSAVAMGTVGLGTTIAIGAATGAISGAAGGAAYGLVEGTLSGRDSKTTAQNTLNGAVSGFTSGALTGGFGSALTGSTAGLSNPLLRYGADAASETAVDTLVDSATGGNVTPTSIATSLALNAVTEGVSVRGAKGAKADVNTNKPKAGDVPVTKSHKDMTPVQQLALPGPTSKPLALPAPKSTPKTDFYVNPNGVATKANLGEPITLYRGDRSTVSPDIVFDSGFKPKGTSNNLQNHVSSNTTAGNFVSTSSNLDIATGFAGKNGYIYNISTNRGIDVNSTLGIGTPYPEQMDFSVPGGINASEVRGAWPVNKNVVGSYISNPNFGGRR